MRVKALGDDELTKCFCPQWEEKTEDWPWEKYHALRGKSRWACERKCDQLIKCSEVPWNQSLGLSREAAGKWLRQIQLQVTQLGENGDLTAGVEVTQVFKKSKSTHIVWRWAGEQWLGSRRRVWCREHSAGHWSVYALILNSYPTRLSVIHHGDVLLVGK